MRIASPIIIVSRRPFLHPRQMVVIAFDAFEHHAQAREIGHAIVVVFLDAAAQSLKSAPRDVVDRGFLAANGDFLAAYRIALQLDEEKLAQGLRPKVRESVVERNRTFEWNLWRKMIDDLRDRRHLTGLVVDDRDGAIRPD